MKLTPYQRQLKLAYTRKAVGMACRTFSANTGLQMTLDKLLRYGNSYIAVIGCYYPATYKYYNKASQDLQTLLNGMSTINSVSPNKYSQFAVDMLTKAISTDWSTK